MKANLRYCVTFGEGDSSDWLDWSVELTEEEEKLYIDAIEKKIPLSEVEELQDALYRVYDEIKEEELANCEDAGFDMDYDDYDEFDEDDEYGDIFDCGWSINIEFADPNEEW